MSNSVSLQFQSSSIPKPIPSSKTAPYEPRFCSAISEFFRTFPQRWSYLGKEINLTRYILSVWTATPRKNDQIIRTIILRLKLFSIVNVIVNSITLHGQIPKIKKAIKMNDYSGAGSEAFAFMATFADSLDYLGTFVNTVRITFSRSMLGVITQLSLPIGIVGSISGLLARSWRIIHHANLQGEIKKELSAIANNRSLSSEAKRHSMLMFLGAKLGEGEYCLKSRVRPLTGNILDKDTHQKVKLIFKELFDCLKSNSSLKEADLCMIKNRVVKLDALLQRDKNIQKGYLLSNIFYSTAFIFSFMPAMQALRYSLMAAATIVRLTLQVIVDSRSSDT